MGWYSTADGQATALACPTGYSFAKPDPFYRASHQLYTQFVVGRPLHANDTRFNSFIDQIAWIYREIGKNEDRLERTTDTASIEAAIRSQQKP